MKIVVSGVGRRRHAIIQLLHAQGAGNIIACDRNGAIHRGETYADEHRQWIADNTNPEGLAGTLHEVLAGADVFIGVSAPNMLGRRIATMATDAIVFALANPDPESTRRRRPKHAAVVATGRSDFPNQINNVLAFPGLFRGLLDAGGPRHHRRDAVAAAEAIADCVSRGGAQRQLHRAQRVRSARRPAVAQAVAATA